MALRHSKVMSLSRDTYLCIGDVTGRFVRTRFPRFRIFPFLMRDLIKF
jgi:hypothetical protein